MLSDDCPLYWGDFHVNLHPEHMDRLDECFAAARDVLDFFPLAYYPFEWREIGGFRQESAGQRPLFLDQWKAVCAKTAACNDPGRFVCFPGYEWHGDRRRWGDHNVFYKTDDAPLDAADTLSELYDHLRACDGLAIPHHVGYQPGERGKDWAVFDERLSPLVEIFSSHGSSEGYGSPLPMERNTGMGPLVQAGSAATGLTAGHHFGLIASGDLHNVYPTQWGTGVAACYATDLTRDALWDAFHARRVYAVTGDRIRLDVEVAGLPMGAIGRAKPPYRIRVRAEGSDAIARVELLRNNVVIGGTFLPFDPNNVPTGRRPYKFHAAFGWGPRQFRHKRDVPPRDWQVDLALDNGRLLGVEKMWTRFGQRVESVSDTGCRFRLHTEPPSMGLHTDPAFQRMGFTVEGTPETRVRLTVNGLVSTFTLADARHFPAVFAERQVAERLLNDWSGVTPDRLRREQEDLSSIWHTAYKTHVWPAVHEGEYRADVEYEDTPDHDRESWYTVRVIQNNGQLAWSSPVWVTPE